MENLSVLPILCGKLRVDYPSKGPVMQTLMFVWTNYWTNSRIVGDMRHFGEHVTSL